MNQQETVNRINKFCKDRGMDYEVSTDMMVSDFCATLVNIFEELDKKCPVKRKTGKIMFTIKLIVRIIFAFIILNLLATVVIMWVAG